MDFEVSSNTPYTFIDPLIGRHVIEKLDAAEVAALERAAFTGLDGLVSITGAWPVKAFGFSYFCCDIFEFMSNLDCCTLIRPFCGKALTAANKVIPNSKYIFIINSF